MISKRLILNNWLQIALSIIFVVIFIIRIKYWFAGIERDEGVYVYGAWRLSEGEIPFVDYFDIKSPAIYIIYLAILLLFDWQLIGVKIATTFAVGIISWLTAKSFATHYKEKLVIFVATWTSLSLTFSQGNFAQPEIFMTLCIMMSCYYFLTKENSDARLVLSGLLAGLAVFIKLTALTHIISILLLLILDRNIRKIIAFTLATSFFPLLYVLTYLFIGNFDAFWFANITYTWMYIRSAGVFATNTPNFPIYIFLENPLIWVLSFMFILNILKKHNVFLKSKYYALLLFQIVVGLSFMQIRGFNSGHHYLAFIPFLVVTSVAAIKHISILTNKLLYVLMVPTLLIIIIQLVSPSHKLHDITHGYLNQWWHQDQEISTFIQQNTNAGEYIYNLGIETQLYFYSQRPSPSRYIHDRQFIWFPETIGSVCQDFINKPPKLVILTRVPPLEYSDHAIEWWRYLSSCANLVVTRTEQVGYATIWFTEPKSSPTPL